MSKIFIAGDYCPNARAENIVRSGDFSSIFNGFEKIISDASLSIVNLECPVYDNLKNYTINKIGPSLKTTSKSIDALQFAGFNLLTLANNHIMDYGEAGLQQTINACISKGISYVGAGSNLRTASAPFCKMIDGKKVTIINIAENEFSSASKGKAGSNPLNFIDNYSSIKSSVESSDYTVVIYHGGHEGFSYPSPRMKSLFKFYVDIGVNAVICHHSHRYSGFEKYKDGLIFYGLGNFYFDWPGIKDQNWFEGYAVTLDINNNEFKLHPYIQCKNTPSIEALTSEQDKLFQKRIASINKVIANDQLLEQQFDDLVNSRSRTYLSELQPYPGYYISGAYRKGILPNLITKKQYRKLLNIIRCEAHYDILRKKLEEEVLKND